MASRPVDHANVSRLVRPAFKIGRMACCWWPWTTCFSPELVFLLRSIQLPEHELLALRAERQIVIESCMDVDPLLVDVSDGKALQPIEMRAERFAVGVEAFAAAVAVALARRYAAVAQPPSERRLLTAAAHHHVLVIALQDDPPPSRQRRSRHQQLDARAGLWSAVDEVAKADERAALVARMIFYRGERLL